MYLVFIADQYGQQGGAADLVGTIDTDSNNLAEALIPLLRKYAGSDDPQHNWTACSIFVSVLNPTTLEMFGAEFDLNLRGSLGFNPPESLIVKEYEYYKDGERQEMPMIPRALHVDWLSILGYKDKDDDSDWNEYGDPQ
jgi:hypothetical protein